MKNTRYIKGFTLIDILLSTAIISLLSSVVLFTVSEAKTKAQDAKMKVESSQVANAIELFKSDNQGFTPIKVWSENGAVSPGISPGVLYKENSAEFKEIMNKLIEGKYISEIPQSPDGTSYAYGESIDGTQAMFAAELKNQSNASNNTQTSCSQVVMQPTEVAVPAPCMSGIAPIAVAAPMQVVCAYNKPLISVADNFVTLTSTITVASPASWDCKLPTDPGMNCSISNQGTIPYGCDIQGFTWKDKDGVSASFCFDVTDYRTYSCVGTYVNPPPCTTVTVDPGYVCTNVTESIYEICPIEQPSNAGERNLCDGTSNSDYCTCI